MLDIKITVPSVEEFRSTLHGMLGEQSLNETPTEVLLDLVRSRLEKVGYAVEVKAAGEGPLSPSPLQNDRPKRGRPRKTEPEDEAIVPQKAGETAAVPEKEPEQAATPPVEPVGNGNGAAPSADAAPNTSLVAATEAPANPTRDDMILALNAFAAARGGQVAGRQKMQEVCGTARLMDVKPEQYPALLAALKVAA